MAGANTHRDRTVVAGRSATGILGKTQPVIPQRPVKSPPSARKAGHGPQPPMRTVLHAPAAPKKPAPPAPGWLAGFAKGVDVTTQFLHGANPKDEVLFDWETVVNATEFRIPGGRAVKDRMNFIVIKATLGSGPNAVARNFKANWDKLRSMFRRVIVGAYHFLLFGPKEDPIAQARAYVNAVGPFFAILPPVVDIEDMRPATMRWLGFESHVVFDPKKNKDVLHWTIANRAQFKASTGKCANDIKLWLKTVRDLTHREPIIYTFPAYWPTIGSPKEFRDSPLWIADYRPLADAGPSPRLPVGGGWSTWTFWQFAGFPQTASQFVPGIGSGVDLNIYNGTAAKLQAEVYKNLFAPSPITPFF
jgi:GH25 family lysozyme M1 (1,4-beta-N-acetylmuramidase)